MATSTVNCTNINLPHRILPAKVQNKFLAPGPQCRKDRLPCLICHRALRGYFEPRNCYLFGERWAGSRTSGTSREASRHNHLAGSKSITGETMKLSCHYLPTTSHAWRNVGRFWFKVLLASASLRTIVMIEKGIRDTLENVATIAILHIEEEEEDASALDVSVLRERYCSLANFRENFIRFKEQSNFGNSQNKTNKRLFLDKSPRFSFV